MDLATAFRGTGLTQAQIAARAHAHPVTVSKWISGALRPGPERALALEAEFGLPRHLLRPDLWDAPPAPSQDQPSQDQASAA